MFWINTASSIGNNDFNTFLKNFNPRSHTGSDQQPTDGLATMVIFQSFPFLREFDTVTTTEEIKNVEGFNQKVRISTAHGYKGLEAEIVIILRGCDGSFPLLHPDNCLFEFFGQSKFQTLEEERRLFYVSVSRQSQALYILTEKGNESSFL